MSPMVWIIRFLIRTKRSYFRMSLSRLRVAEMACRILILHRITYCLVKPVLIREENRPCLWWLLGFRGSLRLVIRKVVVHFCQGYPRLVIIRQYRTIRPWSTAPSMSKMHYTKINRLLTRLSRWYPLPDSEVTRRMRE